MSGILFSSVAFSEFSNASLELFDFVLLGVVSFLFALGPARKC